MKCSKIMYKGDSLLHNNGFILTSTAFVIQVVATIFSYTLDLSSLTAKITPNPSIKVENSNSVIDSNDCFVNKVEYFECTNIKVSKRINTRTFTFQESEYNNYETLILPSSTFKKGKLFYIMNNDIDNFPFKLAKENDKRNCISMFCKIFKEKELLLRALIKKSRFEMISINISLLFSYIEITFTVNALFFNHNLISQRYNDKDTLYTYLFISFISYVISSFIFFLLRYLISYAPMLELIFSDVRGKQAIDIITQKANKKIKIKMIIFYITQFIMIIFFMYYLSCFCCVYHSAQFVWFICALVSLVIGFLICLLLSIIESLLRFAGIKCNSVCVYNLYLS